MSHCIYVGLGTNVGDRSQNLRAALQHLISEVVRIERISSVYRSEPVHYTDQPFYWNLAVCGRCPLAPPAVLERTQGIERALGRVDSFRFGPRLIDIDLLLYNDRVMVEDDLVVPHPRMLERAFVMRPLVEIDPAVRHPGTGKRVLEHLADAEGRLEDTERLFPGSELLHQEET